jgi:threonine dehydratase
MLCPAISPPILTPQGNHAQAIALAAKQKGISAHIIMPTISQPAKIAATKGYGAHVYFSGSAEPERAAVAAQVQADTGAVFVPPYDHPHIILGQGTMGLELEDQVADILEDEPRRSAHHRDAPSAAIASDSPRSPTDSRRSVPLTPWPSNKSTPSSLDALIAPLGGGGMLSGLALAFSHSRCWVFGAEPSEGGADDGRRGLAQGKRIEHVNTLTIADGLRTPVGRLPWSVISDKRYVRGVYSVTDQQICQAMRLILERLKVVVEPSSAVGLAVALYDEDFRRMVEQEGGEEGWDVGIVLSGGNTTVEAIARMYGEKSGAEGKGA